MSIALRSALLTASLLMFSSCAGAPEPSGHQTLVESVAAKNSDIVRLTLHLVPSGESDYKAVASTLASKIGKPSDPEDLEAIRTGKTVVLDEPGGIDVTIPIQMVNGKHTVAAGVTLKKSVGRVAAINAANAIAAELENALANR